jgi:hypothetical protein
MVVDIPLGIAHRPTDAGNFWPRLVVAGCARPSFPANMTDQEDFFDCFTMKCEKDHDIFELSPVHAKKVGGIRNIAASGKPSPLC